MAQRAIEITLQYIRVLLFRVVRVKTSKEIQEIDRCMHNAYLCRLREQHPVRKLHAENGRFRNSDIKCHVS